MGRPPAFQFYPNDWLSSPTILLMTPAQEGAYIRLLCYCWSDKDCSLPDDDRQLGVLSRLGEQAFNECSSVMREVFVEHPTIDGRLTNIRLLNERNRLDERREQQRQAGIKSGQSRRKATNDRSTPVERPPVAKPEHPLNSSTSTSASASASSNKPVLIPDGLRSVEFQAAWADWLQYRKGMRKPLQPASQQRQLDQFSQWGQDRAIMAIEHTIRMGWQGVREPESRAGVGPTYDGLSQFSQEDDQ